MLGGLDLLSAKPKPTRRRARPRDRDDLSEPAHRAQSDPPGRPPDRRRADPPRQCAAPATRRQRAIEMLRAVGITDPARRAKAYPFEMSGGMCQRVMIAIALAAKPSLLIADEPTTGLDVTTQAVIMDLDQRSGAQTRHGDDLHHPRPRARRPALGAHRRHACRPRRRERADQGDCSQQPRHPYTAELIAATPDSAASLDELASIPGSLPDLRRTDLPPCRYSERCPRKMAACAQPLPHSVARREPLCGLLEPASGKYAACAYR